MKTPGHSAILEQHLLSTDQVIKTCGGFSRFYATDVPVEDVASMTQKRPYSNVLCCCEGGDFALTFMGLGKKGTNVYAFDTCSAQLFLLAAKLQILKDPKLEEFAPSFNDIAQKYPGRIKMLPEVIHKFGIHAKLVNLNTKKEVKLSETTSDQWGVKIFPVNQSDKTRVFWSKHQAFLKSIRENIPNVRFLREDIFYICDIFPKEYFDVIYISDIHIALLIPHFEDRIQKLIDSLAPGGVIIGDADCNREMDNLPTLIEIIEQRQSLYNMELAGKKGAVLGIRKIGTRRRA